MASFIDWFSKPRKGSPLGSATVSLAVERLEPRQLLAADSFFLLELSPAAEPLGETVELWRDQTDQAFCRVSGGSDFGLAGSSFDSGYRIYLEEVVDQIGDLFEAEDIRGEEPLAGQLPWFS